jgi:predicted MPP superfamily phosphohydrolase
MQNTMLQNTPDFIVEIPKGKQPTVLFLADPQTIDAEQKRYPERVDDKGMKVWATNQMESCCYQYIRETVAETKPDLIIIVGDCVYGEFDDNGTALQSFVEFMESLKVPYAPVFGNHEADSKMGVDWQCAQFENAKNCLFKQRTLTGNGNYSVGIAQNGKLLRVFYLMDTNGSYGASEESRANGHFGNLTGFAPDQIEWYTNQIKEIKKENGNIPVSFAFHIPMEVFKKAFEDYSVKEGEVAIDIALLPQSKGGAFGYLSNPHGEWDKDGTLFNALKELGTDSIFVGHLHANSCGTDYNGVRLQFVQKSSRYDSILYRGEDGAFKRSYMPCGTPVVGGTVLRLGEQGEMTELYHYLCDAKWESL